MSVMTTSKVETFIKDLTFNSNVDLQKFAFQKLKQLDFPTTKDEYWKYTRLGKITNNEFRTSTEAIINYKDIEAFIVTDNFMVIENGIVRSDLSSFDLGQVNIITLPVPEVENSLGQIKTNPSAGDSIFDELNTAFIEKVTVISVPKNIKWDSPVQVLYVQSGNNTIANTRLIIESETSASAHIISTFVSINANNCLTNHITQINVADNAQITFDKLQIESGFNISTEYVTQQDNSTFKINTITLDGELVRNNLNIEVEGQNCETYLNGAVIAKDKQVIDNHTFVNQLVPHCMSDEKYKYVLDGKSIGTFNGRVVVHKDAQKINAFQDNGNILLSDYAKINAKPELEIYADDVKCSHGSTTGQLDEKALFYLQARGISKPKARHLLVQAFVGDVLTQIENEKLNTLIYSVLEDRFGWEF
jgi:Fe-S cluster assembly protein SufD